MVDLKPNLTFFIGVLGVQSNAGLICGEYNSAVAKCEKIPVPILYELKRIQD